LEPQGPTERTIMVGDNTKINVNVQLTPDELSAAMKIYQDSMKAGKPVIPPNPFTEKPASIDDIKIGMVVSITAASDIRSADVINATQIVFDALPSSNPATPVAPPSVPMIVQPPSAPAPGKPVVPPPVMP